MRALGLTLCLALCACGADRTITDAEREKVEAFVTEDYAYRSPLKFERMWRKLAGHSLICGEFEAPPEFGGNPKSLRFVYDLSNDVAQIEKHRMVIGTTAATEALLDQNRQIFDGLWRDHCAPARPWLA